MQTKLTLRLEDQLIEQAKSYAAQAGKSVSQIVADYFKLLTSQKIKASSPSTPITQSLRGLLRESKLDEKDYKKYLEEKHL
jgi:replicative DNA helicase